jgi:hypothetical protein
MLTWRGTGEIREQLRVGLDHCEALRAAAFEVVRLKLEASPANLGVPQTNCDLAGADPSRYFEHHVKFATMAGKDLDGLSEATGMLGGRLSRNAFRTHADGGEERFVTQRCYGAARETALQRLEELVRTVSSQGFSILEVEQEYVVWDSEAGLDSGWLDRE